MTPAELEQIYSLRARGLNAEAIAARLGLDVAHVREVLNPQTERTKPMNEELTQPTPAEPPEQTCLGCFFLRGSRDQTCRRSHRVVWTSTQERPQPHHPCRGDARRCADYWDINAESFT